MKSSLRLLAMTALVVCAANAQPVVNAVLNNASYALPGLSNSGIARGSLFVVFGTGLATGNLTATAFPLSPNMGGTSVRVTVGGTGVDALMVYTTPGQIGALLPSNTPEGTGQVVVSLNGRASAAGSITVVKSAFGTFTSNQAGSGPGAIQNFVSATDQPVNALNKPAKPGQTVILWGTGLGPTSADETKAPVTGNVPGVNVSVYVGGKLASVSYAGRSGCCSAIDQIAFAVPAGVEGCYVPVVVKTDDVVSNFSTIAVSANGSTCSDPTGLSSDGIQTAQTSGTLRTGTISLARTTSKFSIPGFGDIESKTDSGNASFDRFNLAQLLASQSVTGANSSVSLGACTVVTFRMNGDDSVFTDPIQPTPLDAGPWIDVTGPRGTKRLTKTRTDYSGELGGGTAIPGVPGAPVQPDFLEPGNYTITNGSGGSGADAVGAFNVNFTMPQMVTWTNQANIATVNRTAGQEITWSGGDPNGYVYMTGVSANDKVAAAFYCLERTSATRFTIPSYVTLLLPQTATEGFGALSVGGVTAQTAFKATGLDAGYINASAITLKTVTYR